MAIVYIAGPMSGLPFFNRPAFNQAAAELSKKGFTVLNPATLPNGLTQPQYMDICCAMLRCADKIFMLSHWERSDGASAEYALAKKLGIEAIFQGRPLPPVGKKECLYGGHAFTIPENPGDLPICAYCGTSMKWGNE
ncbi:TPA: DUF4406 domain-containing protein [Enterobacter asburiae]|nr:DUF4406 domain-containing protein [Enterobacter asburiae]HCD7492178.1 DUF4406 domain-containing protein [Enterobacter asburiae]HEB5011372.1 DUF4406 domain-containing protein [Enterobacter asburiae]HEG1767665.1 DUF4406 domain-containing protein [Enterobacter asburiae]HEG2040573.1 DUF4406 domain-containing protein [Enterobacter asburiae]